MPLIKLEFDNEKVPTTKIQELSESIKEIVSKITNIEDVFVYANSSQIKVNIAPVEIFIEMSAKIIKDEDELIKEIRNQLSEWKEKNNFEYPINLTLIPMNWKIEIGI